MVELRMLEPATRFILQGGSVARRLAGEKFGVPLPESACRSSSQDDRAALWLGPDERLLLGPADDRQALGSGLESALADVAHSLVDVSQRQLAVLVSGPRASSILNTGCPLDLDLSGFPPGMCSRTLLGKAEIVLWRRSAAEYHLEVGRSFSDYVLGWLQEAGRADFRGWPIERG